MWLQSLVSALTSILRILSSTGFQKTFQVDLLHLDKFSKAISKGFSDRRGKSPNPRSEHDRKLDRSVSRKRGVSTSSMEVKDHAAQSYYMKSLQYYYNLPSKTSEAAKKYKDHFLQSLASIKYLKKLRIPSIDNLIKSRMQLAKLDNNLANSSR